MVNNDVNEKYAFMVAGTHSGCGKTTLALALMAALRKRGLRVQPFKVGPDFIDPGFHSVVTGVESRNLDGWMLGIEYNRELFTRRVELAQAAVVEGVMGLFDGYDGRTERGSSAEMGKWLGIPVVLVVDARSMARSAAALVHGFRTFDPDLNFSGVIFNRVGSPGHLQYLEEAMEGMTDGLPVLGGIPRREDVTLPERHLGLVTAQETVLTESWLQTLVRLVEDHVNLDRLLERSTWTGPEHSEEAGTASCNGFQSEGKSSAAEEIAGFRKPLAQQSPSILQSTVEKVPIAVARDAAFCFYYPDNLEFLESFGARLEFFSPLEGECLPEHACGLYLGGGYPELFAGQLSEHREFLGGLRCAAARGMPIHAECGGLMVLSRYIETLESTRYPMAGLLPFGTRMLSRRKALGYTEVELMEPCLLGLPGSILRGHEFHYSEIVDMNDTASPAHVYTLKKRKLTPARQEGYAVGTVLASYIHLHWGSAPEAPRVFVSHCREYCAKSRNRRVS